MKTYNNPVMQGFYPDPSTIRVGDDYYTVTSTFQYFPCVTISHSKDLVHWQIIGHGITDSDYLDLTNFYDGCGIWAPDLSYDNGVFYLFICLVQLTKDRKVNMRGNYVMTSKNVSGPYNRPIQLNNDGNDPSHFIDDDGTHYMVYGVGSPLGKIVKLAKLNKECNLIVEEPFSLNLPEEMAAPEGPHLLKKDGYYYLMIAASRSRHFVGHHQLILRSKYINGTYEESPNNPFLAKIDNGIGMCHTGHGKIFSTQNGDWWTTFICQRRINGFSILGRETALNAVDWTLDGWPVVNNGVGANDVACFPELPEQKQAKVSLDNFDYETLDKQWLCVRNPLKDAISLLENNGYLRLYTTPYDLDDLRHRNIIVRRETSFVSITTSKLNFKPMIKGQEAGIVCYYDTSSFVKLGIVLKNKLTLHVMTNNKYEKHINAEKIIDDFDTIYLKIETDYLLRKFYYSCDNISWEMICIINDCSFLSDQGTSNWGFTGTMTGMYALSMESCSNVYADFDWFNYEAL